MSCIVIILSCKLLQPLLNKKCSMELTNTRLFMKYMIIRQFAAAVIAFLLCGAVLQADPEMLLFGAAFAFCLTVCTYVGIAAMQSSAMVMVSLFEMAGLLVPCVAGIFLFSEALKTAHVFGLIACIVSAFLLTDGRITSRLTIKSWLLLFVCLFSNGGIMLTQKLFSISLPNGNIAVFHFWGFIFSAIFSFLIYVFTRREEVSRSKLSLKLGVYGVILSAAMLTISILSTFVSSFIPAVVLFSMVNGGGLLLCTVVSVFLYKEKLSVKMLAGLVLGAAALMMINFA